MERVDIFKDIAERTGGDIYIGVVGPVRTGKSTFIKRFMEQMVIPNISNEYDRARTIDEMPQSAAGRTIMTTEPKFVPNQAVTVHVAEGLDINVRLVDCVGYTVEGAKGYEDEHGPRMIHTPWFDEPIPFHEAAEIGTRKVIQEHSTLRRGHHHRWVDHRDPPRGLRGSGRARGGRTEGGGQALYPHR
jgi:Stage IV sporulation protein A (spore_IV_A).